jgi:hypothetical protein
MRVHGTKLGAISTGRGLGDQLYDLAGQVPSLDLNFAATKAVGPLVTFTRASSATYIDSAGTLQTAAVDVPRFDHNPTTGESLGLLVEEQRTNLLLRSEEFDNASWNPPDPSIATVTPNAQIAPNGTLTADTFTTVSGTPALFQAVACLASTAYTWSFYVKLGTMAAADFRFAVRDDTNGAFIATDIAPSITPVTTEWRRVTYTFTTPVGCVLVRPYPYRFNPATYGTTVHLWGAQLEAGSFPSSYIPTTTAAVTRSADVASITGANFSSWYRQDEGTVFVSAGVQDFTQTNFPRLFSIDRGDISSNFIAAVRGSGTRRLDYSVFADGIGQATGLNNGIAPAANTTVNGAWVYKANDFIGAVNGVLTNSDTSGSVPTLLTTFGVGMQGNATLHYNGTIKRLTFFPQRLPDSTLQAITQ